MIVVEPARLGSPRTQSNTALYAAALDGPYRDLLDAPLPERLRSLVERLKTAEQARR